MIVNLISVSRVFLCVLALLPPRAALRDRENDYDEYVKRIEDNYVPPPLPEAPMKPNPPDVAEKLYEINTEFRTRKNQYFATSSRLNWLACAAALMLVGGLVYLLMFDANGQRWHYLSNSR